MKAQTTFTISVTFNTASDTSLITGASVLNLDTLDEFPLSITKKDNRVVDLGFQSTPLGNYRILVKTN